MDGWVDCCDESGSELTVSAAYLASASPDPKRALAGDAEVRETINAAAAAKDTSRLLT